MKNKLSNMVIEFILKCPEKKLGDLSIGKIIDEFEVSRANLYKQFKQSKHFTINEFINQQKAFRAAILLLEDDGITVKALSEKMGFCNSEYFIQVFEKYFGITPGRYKKLFLKEKHEEHEHMHSK